jgi:hypothetical protein
VEFVRAGMSSPAIWSELRGQIYLGGDTFAERLRKLADHEIGTEIPRAQRRPVAQPIEYYRLAHDDRRSAMAAAFASGDYTMRQIADAFGVHYSTVSRAVRSRTESAAGRPV